MKRMIDSEVSDRIKYGYDENNESHIKIEADNVDVPFLVAGGSGIYSDGQVSAPNIITDEMSTRVADSINFANAIKATGGFTPIHTYKLDGVTTLYVYFEHPQYGDFIGYGWITNIGNVRPCIFHYALQDGKVIRFRGLSDDIIYDYSNNTVKTFTIAKKEQCQAKLYRHIITMVANTEEGDPETSIIEYISTNNLKVASLQDLTTLLKPTANFIYPLGPVVNADLGGITDYNQLEYSDSVWKFAGSASNTTKINVASVSDVVTTL